MLLETLEWSGTATQLHLIFALGLGLVFGAAAQVTRFCLRRAVAGEAGGDRSAAANWATALGVAVIGFDLVRSAGLVNVEGHRLLSSDLPILAILLGGLAFGAGMVLTRGCASRLTVLAATGNLRAVMVLFVFALVAHATLKGVLAPLRVGIGAVTVELPVVTLSALPGAALAIGAGLLLLAVFWARHSGARVVHLLLAALIGLVAVAGWVGTGTLLMDEFDPLPVQSAAFTQPWTDSLFWAIASSSIPAGFGVGFVAGVLVGSFTAATLRNEIALQGFGTPEETLRYALGGALMGFGGVLAGGCTVGAGLSGGAMLSVAALLALATIIAGAVLTRAILAPRAVAVSG